MDAVRLIRRALDGKVPLIGFAGAPFTMLTYVVEGQTGKQFAETKKLLYTAPAAAHLLLQKLTDTVADYLAAQIRAGAQVVQLFDSWVGQLAPDDFRVFAAPYVKQLVDKLRRSARPSSTSPTTAARSSPTRPSSAPTRSASTGARRSTRRALAPATA